MSWQELSISVPHEYVEPVSYLFSRYGKGLSTEPQGAGRVLLRTFLESGSEQRLARIDIGIRLISSIEPLGELAIRDLDDGEDWQNSWKEHYDALPIGSRLIIKPSWVELGQEETDGRLVIELDPGIAFGTGYHPSTYTCMEALEELVQPGMQVLDLGTGSGILTITALQLGAASAVALDIDGQAVSAARQNFRRLRMQDRITLVKGSVPHPRCPGGNIRPRRRQHLRAGCGRPRPLHFPGPPARRYTHRLRPAGHPAARSGRRSHRPGLHPGAGMAP